MRGVWQKTRLFPFFFFFSDPFPKEISCEYTKLPFLRCSPEGDGQIIFSQYWVDSDNPNKLFQNKTVLRKSVSSFWRNILNRRNKKYFSFKFDYIITNLKLNNFCHMREGCVFLFILKIMFCFVLYYEPWEVLQIKSLLLRKFVILYLSQK